MTDYRELVKRLRERAGQYDEYGWHSEIELESADALEAQAKRIAEKDTRISELENGWLDEAKKCAPASRNWRWL